MTLAYENWLTARRWYAGRGRDLIDVTEALVTPLRDDLDLVLLDARYTDGSVDRYQVVIRWGGAPVDEARADVATIGDDGGRTAYDALFDPDASRHLLALVASSETVGPLRFLAEPGAALPLDAPTRVIGAEQSNTSVVFGQDAIFKLFRRVTPGVNPDIELNRVLARAGNDHVARLLGSIETDLGGEPYALGMLTAFAAGSTEGWDMATASVRDGFTDFTAESRLLGEAVATVHRTLAAELGSEPREFPLETLLGRLGLIANAVPRVAQYADVIEERYRGLAGTSFPVQRVHGDLHLGQVLRTPQAWLVIDFEGEPGQPLPERRRPDSPVRDVAGVLRSYEYAAFQRLVGHGDDEALAAAARQWVDGNAAAFCDGYAAAAGADPRATGELLAAYELDKAIYEAGYEARYRPDWLPIPMASIARLLS